MGSSGHIPTVGFWLKCVGRTRFCVFLPSDVSALLGYVRVVNSDVVAAKFTAMWRNPPAWRPLHCGGQTLRRNMHAIRPQVQAVWLGGYVLRRRRLRRHPEGVNTLDQDPLLQVHGDSR